MFKDLRLARAASCDKKETSFSLTIPQNGSTISVIHNNQLASYQCWQSLVQVSLSVISDGLGLGSFLSSFLFLSLNDNFSLIGNNLINVGTRLSTSNSQAQFCYYHGKRFTLSLLNKLFKDVRTKWGSYNWLCHEEVDLYPDKIKVFLLT